MLKIKKDMLEDYEEGIYTPTVVAGTASYGTSTYTKIGNQVNIHGQMYAFSERVSTATLGMAGLPYVSNAGVSSTGSCMSHLMGFAGLSSIVTYLPASSSQLLFYMVSANGENIAWQGLRHDFLGSAGSQMIFDFTYTV